jgi:crotonobetainyl-CoA:carnitine CoA-transferase CaiB-like acyl-CoA transferase
MLRFVESALKALLTTAGAGELDLSEVEICGCDPVLTTRFRVCDAAALALAAGGAVAARCWELRTGRRQRVRVEAAAAGASLLGFAFQRVEGVDLASLAERRNVTDFYATRDGRHVLVHGGFPHLQQGILEVLEIDADEPAPKQAVASAIACWDALALEEAVAERRLCGAMVRTSEEWAAHPQGVALAGLPVVEVQRIGDSPPEPFGEDGHRPLSGLRVLDLTRVLAGPTCARTLAAQGAEVLKINSPDLPSIPFFVMDTGHGKRSAFLNLRESNDADRLRALVREADVFSQGYRLRAMERLGFDAEALHAMRPGLVYTSINCYGHEGPWQDRAGWEQLAQTVTGIAAENGGAGGPALLPAAATDYTTGYLAALGTMVALSRRAVEGGSYRVRVSLSQTGSWLQSLGRSARQGEGLTGDILAKQMTSSDTPHGKLHHLGPILEMSETIPRWQLPSVPLGTHPPAWSAWSA